MSETIDKILRLSRYVYNNPNLESIPNWIENVNVEINSTESYVLFKNIVREELKICNYDINSVEEFYDHIEIRIKDYINCFTNNLNLDVLNSLTSYKYETKKAHGIIAICDDETDLLISFSEKNRLKFNSENLRGIRKQLEMSSEKLCLVLKKNGRDYETVGIANISNVKCSFYFVLVGLMHWHMLLGGTMTPKKHKIITYKYGRYFMENSMFDENHFISIVEEMFPGIEKQVVVKISDFIKTISKQKTGASLVILSEEKAKSEAERLCALYKRGTKIEKFDLRKSDVTLGGINDIALGITSIDGTLLMSASGVIYAIGVILDGVAEIEGTPNRGARYNSMVTYVQDKQAVGIIISEDETMDVVTKRLKR